LAGASVWASAAETIKLNKKIKVKFMTNAAHQHRLLHRYPYQLLHY
jgi:hypothetical protein